MIFIVGALHCVCVSDQGEVYTWGDNDEGQLGDSTTTGIQKPRLVATLQVENIFGGKRHKKQKKKKNLTMSLFSLKRLE